MAHTVDITDSDELLEFPQPLAPVLADDKAARWRRWAWGSAGDL
jgi:hypothetical protein